MIIKSAVNDDFTQIVLAGKGIKKMKRIVL
jgi:hypothetical protein